MSMNDPIKRHRVDDWILKNPILSTYLLQGITSDPKTHTQTKSEGIEKDISCK